MSAWHAGKGALGKSNTRLATVCVWRGGGLDKCVRVWGGWLGRVVGEGAVQGGVEFFWGGGRRGSVEGVGPGHEVCVSSHMLIAHANG